MRPVAVFPPAAGTQVVRYSKVELESVVPNSHPETYVNLRGQSPTEWWESSSIKYKWTEEVSCLDSSHLSLFSSFFSSLLLPFLSSPPLFHFTLFLLPGNLLADSIDNAISEDSLASLIQMPGGCVEQNLASITLPLIATLYLERSEDWESVGVERKDEAIRYIKRGDE